MLTDFQINGNFLLRIFCAIKRYRDLERWICRWQTDWQIGGQVDSQRQVGRKIDMVAHVMLYNIIDEQISCCVKRRIFVEVKASSLQNQQTLQQDKAGAQSFRSWQLDNQHYVTLHVLIYNKSYATGIHLSIYMCIYIYSVTTRVYIYMYVDVHRP